MKAGKINSFYKAEDIEKYFTGKLLPAQMHDIEMAALNDPFLQDAMDGYAIMNGKNWKAQLNAVRANFADKKTSAKLVPFYNMVKFKTAVAAVLIISCGIALTYRLTSNNIKNNKTIVTADIKQKPVGGLKNIVSSTDSTAVPFNKMDSSFVKQNESGKPFIAQVKPSVDIIQNDKNVVTTDKFKAVERNSATGLVSKIHQADSVEIPADATFYAAENNAAAKPNKFNEAYNTNVQNKTSVSRKKEAALTQRFAAAVVAADSTPLPFAHIHLVQDNIGTYAGVTGKFMLVAEDSIIEIEVRAAGYETKKLTLKSSMVQNTIVLNEVEVAEKSIVKFNNSKAKISETESRRTMQMDTVTDVEPADGWSNYNTYLSNNLSPSDEVLKKNIHGEVQVSFEVQNSGKLSNLNIAKSLCEVCDQEALRVIKQGPQWKVKKGKKDKVIVKIKF